MATRKKAAKKRARKAPAKKKASVKKRAKRKPVVRAADPLLPPGFVGHQFKPGQSGNPKGRPKRRSFDEAVRHVLDQEGASGTRVDQLAIILLDECINKRNNKMLKELLARIWPIKTMVEHSNDPESPLTDASPRPDYSKLSQVERKALLQLHTKALRVGDPAN